jgi:sec1 family domain-containing protein 1
MLYASMYTHHLSFSLHHSLCEFKVGSEDETFLTLDPRRNKASSSSAASASSLSTSEPKGGRTPYRDVIVFMIGGGSYSEYQRIQEYCTSHPDRTVTYGSAELINGESFLRQLGSL